MSDILFFIALYSGTYHVDPNLVKAVIKVESNFNSKAISKTGDLGLMQLNPKSFPGYSKKQLLDVETNLKLGIKYLSKLKSSCNMVRDSWVVAYNVGCGKAVKFKYPLLHSYYKKIKLARK